MTQKTSRRFSFVLLPVGLMALCASLTWSQATSTSSISGQVTDQQGAAIPGTEVKLFDPTTSTSMTTSTNDAGRYIFLNVLSGTYSITFTKLGFSAYKIDGQKAEIGSTLTLNATLQIGATTTTVEVSASRGAELQTTNAAVGTTISGDALLSLPNMGRDVSTLAVLQPGATMSGNIAGSVSDQNTYNLDGGNITDDMAGNTTGYNVNFTGFGGTQTSGVPSGVVPTPVESIEEFKVSTFNQTADFNNSIGGQIQMATKRGTNQFHGSAYGFYFATNVGAANTWVANHTPVTLNGVSYDHTPLPSNHRDRFGGSLGGPIAPRFLGGKWFFFFNYEGSRFPNVGVFEKPVPSLLMRAGVIQVPNASGAFVPYNLNPNPVTVNGITYAPAICSSGNSCDPRGIGLNPVIRQLWSKYEPLPNDPIYSGGDQYNTQGFLSTIRAPLNTNVYVGRIDHDFSDKWRFMASYRYMRLTNLTTNQTDIGGAFSGDTLGQPVATAPRPQLPSYFVAGLTTNISQNLINDFRYNYLRNFWQWGDQNSPPQLPGLGGAIEIGNGASSTTGESSSALIPYNVNTQSTRQRFWDGHDHLVRDDLTYIKGNHLIQFGGSYQRNFNFHTRTDNGNGINNQVVYQIASSGITFPAANIPSTVPSNQVSTWNNLYSEVLGLVDQPQVAYIRAGQNLALQPIGSSAFDQAVIPFYEEYFSDTWHMKPTFTLTYSLGYTIEMPPYELNGKQVAVVDGAGTPINALDYLAAKKNAALQGQAYDPLIGWATVRNVGSGLKYPYRPFYGEWSPRASAAWNPRFGGDGIMGKLFGDGKTVLRGGYGRIWGRLNGVGLVLSPLLGVGLIQAVSCTGASSGGQCLGSGNVDPTNAFRIGTDGLSAPIPTPSTNLAQPFFPGANGATPAGDASALDPNFKPQRTDNFNFTIQRELNRFNTIEVGYVGRIIKNEDTEIDLDTVPYMMTLNNQTFAQAYANVYTALAGGAAAAAVPTQPFFEGALGGANSAYCKAAVSCTAAVASNNKSLFTATAVSQIWAQMAGSPSWTLGRTMISSGACANPALPNCAGITALGATSVGLNGPFGYGNYNGLFVTWRARDWHGLTAISNFTWARSLGTSPLSQSSSGATVQDPFNLHAGYGPNGFDIPLTYNLAMSYNTPWRRTQKGLVGHVLGGWTIAPLFFAQSGSPLGVTYSESGCYGCQAFGEATPPASVGSVTEDAVFASHYTGGSSAHTNVSGSNGIGTNSPASMNMFSDPAAVYAEFRRCVLGIDTSCGGYGNIRTLPTWNLDATAAKDIGVWKEGRVGATLSFAFTNVLNHFQPGTPSGTTSLSLSNPTAFGRITTASTANTPRNLEFGLRIHF
jgi:hypothetical protein